MTSNHRLSRRAFVKKSTGGALALGAAALGSPTKSARAQEEPQNPKGSSRTAFSGARVFDGARTREDHAVIVEDGVVLDVIPRERIPPDMSHFHAPDCTVLPGLIDCHVHFMRWQGPQFLAFGITTVRDTGNELKWILDRRKEWQEKPWPRILCLGPIIDGAAPIHEFVSRPCKDQADAVSAVRETAKEGIDGLKFYVKLNPEWVPAMVQAGHAANCKVSMHCSGGGVLSAAQAGVDEFFHYDGIAADVWPDHPAGWLNIWGRPEFEQTLDRQRAVADSLSKSGITATPTLAYWDSQWRIRRPDWADSDDLRRTPAPMVTWQTVAPDRAASEEWRRALRAAQRFTGLLMERGIPILAGSDVPCGVIPPGLSLWRELSLLVEAGMSPLQALQSATSGAASYLGRQELGTLAPGAVADLVLVRGNPLDHIPSQPDIALTVQRGIIHTPGDLLTVVDDSLEDEPWAKQFERHWEVRTQRAG